MHMESGQHHQPITIASCKVTSGDYIKRLCSLFMADHWVWFALPVLILASLAVLNIDFLIVALMAVFIIIPMVLTLLYFNYALTDEARISITEKELKVTDEGLQIKTLSNKLQEYTFLWAEFYGYVVGENFLLLQHDGKYRFFMIPLKAFNDEAQRTECIALVKRCITQKTN